MIGSYSVSKEILKAAINEYINENQEVLHEAITRELEGVKEITEERLDYKLEGVKERTEERLDYILMGQAKDRKRLTDIELLLGLEKSLKDENSEFYADDKERYNQLFVESIFSNMISGSKSKNIRELLYEELKNVSSMRNKDILNFLGWNKRYTSKATRLMHKMAENYPDVICECVPGQKKSLKLYRKLI